MMTLVTVCLGVEVRARAEPPRVRAVPLLPGTAALLHADRALHRHAHRLRSVPCLNLSLYSVYYLQALSLLHADRALHRHAHRLRSVPCLNLSVLFILYTGFITSPDRAFYRHAYRLRSVFLFPISKNELCFL